MQKSEARLKMSDVFDRRVAPVLEKLRQGQQVSESEVSSAVELLIKDTFAYIWNNDGDSAKLINKDGAVVSTIP